MALTEPPPGTSLPGARAAPGGRVAGCGGGPKQFYLTRRKGNARTVDVLLRVFLEPKNLSKKLLTDVCSTLLMSPCSAGVAQLVEHHLAKVDVESSSLFARSILEKPPETTPAVFSCPSATALVGCASTSKGLPAITSPRSGPETPPPNVLIGVFSVLRGVSQNEVGGT